ncbi:hypothetical protein A8926_7603 [Saccharopolyspora spinosa]|uniref:Uncharacterized protein n=1 Tax=Saccharopolyspora spinosa TaxID=60894 RepID=A0A2N3Y933_SACSN|nr:hypothetical protein A8926_7603 [Saccharopolyspora spinosa]
MQTSKVCGRWAALVVRAGVLRRSGNDRLIESGVHVQCAKPAMPGGTPTSNQGRTRRTASPLRPTAAAAGDRVGRVTSITAHPDGLIKVGPAVPPPRRHAVLPAQTVPILLGEPWQLVLTVE